MPLSALVRAYDHVMLDLDGCVWVGDELTPRAGDAIAALRREHRGIAFVTNDSRHAGEEFVRKLWGLGVQASLEEIVTVGGALQHVLAVEHEGDSAVVIGSPALHRHVVDAGLRIVNGTDFAPRAQVVVVATHENFDYRELREAAQAVRGGAVLLGANRDPTIPMPDGFWPGTGAILAAVELAAGTRARTLGKPEPQLFLTALDRLGPGRALHVGDRLDSDLEGANRAGIDAAIVLTGSTTEADAKAAREPAPVAIAASLGALVLDSA